MFARFHLDAGVGDAVVLPVEMIACRDWLAFAGIGCPPIAAISREQQFAEKLHANTLPRNSTNSRVEDLVDLALLSRASGLDHDRVWEALQQHSRQGKPTLCGSIDDAPAGLGGGISDACGWVSD